MMSLQLENLNNNIIVNPSVIAVIINVLSACPDSYRDVEGCLDTYRDVEAYSTRHKKSSLIDD